MCKHNKYMEQKQWKKWLYENVPLYTTHVATQSQFFIEKITKRPLSKKPVHSFIDLKTILARTILLLLLPSRVLHYGTIFLYTDCLQSPLVKIN